MIIYCEHDKETNYDEDGKEGYLLGLIADELERSNKLKAIQVRMLAEKLNKSERVKSAVSNEVDTIMARGMCGRCSCGRSLDDFAELEWIGDELEKSNELNAIKVRLLAQNETVFNEVDAAMAFNYISRQPGESEPSELTKIMTAFPAV